MAKYVLAFDIYGTLLDTSSISKALMEHLQLDKDNTAQVSALWRRYQLEYTWRLNSMNVYKPFDIVTKKALQHALKESGIRFDDDSIRRLMDAYNVLPCFPDAEHALRELTSNGKAKIVVFSNGTQSMVQTALSAAGLTNMTPNIYVADAVGRYKPTPEIYRGLLQSVGKEGHPKECCLVSGNPFDVTGAIAQGMRAIWVDRAGKGWADGILPIHSSSEFEAMKIVHSLQEIPELVSSFE
ncbi:haloacid dehalogenase [Fomitiporia mediterranea MF3/22]|uniref:haloacid dehalogenase n=1 Tax=Fomitiporia mediterranea (strain MF3/22) TaxID=694068 RepID=UPI0004407915|nr:haloacid dehalogenase [Fomitiporia mediterranea MF3/22]EJD07841.1 haloacid dehalogenase [Fomitiporia mediterranea MF3/22]